MAEVRDLKQFRSGFEDGFEPLEAIDLSKCNTVDDVVRAMSHCSFGARNLGEAADVLEEMFRDDRCFKVLTISGALTVAKMQLIFVEMLERNWVDTIVATGALISHGFIEEAGMKHFKHKKDVSDEKLYELGYDRIYDTLELEKNLHDASLIIDSIFGKKDYDNRSFTSPEICSLIGRYLVENDMGGRSILKSAYNHDVPIYIPALNDSELGLDLLSLRYQSDKPPQEPIRIEHSALRDVHDFAERVKGREKFGIFTIGGGVPRNWAQQIGPFIELKHFHSVSPEKEFPRYHYGVRICPEPVHWGGLSGCTYSEGISWGKFSPQGKFAEVYSDATIALPFIIKALMERFDRTR